MELELELEELELEELEELEEQQEEIDMEPHETFPA